MSKPETRPLSSQPDVMAPDGAEVRLLAALAGGSMAHFTLGPGQVSQAVTHRTVEELWFFVGGAGQMWRSHGGKETVVEVSEGVSLSIPLGTRFQFRNLGDTPLCAVAVTMPPWPGEDEAQFVEGKWPASVGG